ncbi:hypothetical protein CGK40_19995 [Vibrio parahaemolyticus]|uniref:hypothetical protein n=1 Tax=Vibrio parahaemolyticus TaxID=670 RepID=UPI00111CD3E9|nr:hypothetical protein [Vibrio parahaemolyticus]TNZ90905.1 hypothetical protein CGK40_19995 [Vibrio parahaemolyticus]
MHYFLAISCSSDKGEVNRFLEKVNEVYPLGDSFSVTDNVRIIKDEKISVPLMIHERLFQNMGDSELSTYGRFLICRLTSDYFGYHGSALWDWLDEKPTSE